MRRRVLTLAIAVVLICSLFTSFAFAATLRASDYISSYNAVIYSSGTKINVDCSITGTGRMKTIGIKSVKIYTSSGTNVATYSYTTDGYEYLMGSDTGRKTASVTYTGTSGKSYYAVHSIVALAVLMQMKQLKYMQENLTIITSPIRQALRKNADLFQLDRL